MTDDHECDLFLLSSHHSYAANRSLVNFARRGDRNVDGWGIGSYVDQKAHSLRSAEAAIDPDSLQVSREFAIAAEAVTSPIILGHLRRTSCGNVRRENNHPFRLDFLDYQWLLVHNGTGHGFYNRIPAERRILTESDSDTPRIFEFLKEQIENYIHSEEKRSLIFACRAAFSDLLSADPEGMFNLILSNGHLSFARLYPFGTLGASAGTQGLPPDADF